MKSGSHFLLVLLMMVIIISFKSCNDEIDPVYRDSMREFVGSISSYAKSDHPDFIIIPQNGHELVSVNGEPDGDPHTDYLDAIDGAGQEDLFYGYSADDRATPLKETNYLLGFLKKCEEHDVEVLVTDYCSSIEKSEDSYYVNEQEGFISFAAPDRELSTIPASHAIYNENTDDIARLGEARNFLYLINPDQYASKTELVNAISATNYDLLILDLFVGVTQLTTNDLTKLKIKANGASRLVIAYMSIGEAENYRYYWNTEWEDERPDWLEKENPRWEGNFKVQYWNPEWQAIIFGKEESYLDKIISAGFDGVYLDIIEAFEYFE